MVVVRLGESGEQGRVRIHGGEEVVGEEPGLAIDPLTGSSHPGGLDGADEGANIVCGLWPMVPVDAVVRRQVADKGLPCLRKFIVFDVEVSDDRAPVTC